MVLKELINSSPGCSYFGAFHASFLLALCAADATAKKRFPREKTVGKRFKDFIRSYMPQICGAKEYWVAVDMPEISTAMPLDENGLPKLPRVGDDFRNQAGPPRLVLMEGVLYHAFRCALSHEADLPDVELLPPGPDGSVMIKVDTKVRISANIIVSLLHIIVNAPENQSTFVEG
jgi:hypothetical protein